MMKQFTLMMAVLAVALSTACQVEPKKSSYEPVSAYKAVEVAPKPKPASDRQARNREELPLGMVAIPVLKKKVGMSDEQIKKVRAVYKSFRPHAEEADATIQDANDKKAAHWAAQPLRKKIFDAVRAICTPEQKAKFNKYLDARRAKLNPISQGTHALEVKSRKLVFKADPKGLDWAARGSLTKTKTGRWIATYTQATQHGRAIPPLPTRLVVVHTSDDEGRTWSKPNCLPDGTSVTGAPLRAEHGHVEPADGGVLTCPNGDLLYLSMTKDHDGVQWHQMRTLQWRSTDNGASWKFEGRSSGIPAGESLSLGKTVESGSIYVTVYGFPASKTDGSNKSNQLLTEEFFQTMLYRSDDNALTWKKVSVYGTQKDRINETGVVCIDKDTIMIVCRTFDEETTKMRISRDRGKTWGPMTDITKYVHVVQQPKLTKFPEEPGRIYLTGRDRIEEFKQRNCLWYTDDVGKTWKMKPVDGDNYFNDSGYGEILKRKDGDLYYLGYRGTDDAADSWEFVLESDYDRTREEIVLDKKYMLFPINNGAGRCRMKIMIDGKLVQDFGINLATDGVDWWAKLDMSKYAGKTATVSVDNLPAGSRGLALIEASDTIRHTQPLYDETLRPQLRFSQMRGWNNDPDGMVYYDGEYHLFWQSNPFGPQGGNCFWGHAVSKDLIHWEELPLALYPRTMAAGYCFSGSANVDHNNTGGWQTGDEKVMVAAFTDTCRGEALAVSNDRGRTWWKYIDENPVIKHEGRDPKLVWYEPGKHWVIAVYDIVGGKKTVFDEWLYGMVGGKGTLAFYTSKDLKTWKLASRLEEFHECPELFELPVDGDAKNKRWVVFGANAMYYVGTFDGKKFTPEHPEKYRLHYGHYYASQCFSLAPDGRVIQIAWAPRVGMPGMPFNQAFSLPAELTLKTTPAGIRLCAQPIKELETLRGEPQTADGQMLMPGKPLRFKTNGQLFDIVVEVQPQGAQEIKLQFGASQVTYNVAAAKLDEMPLPLIDGKVKFRVVIDRPMYEVIGGNGDVYRTARRGDPGKGGFVHGDPGVPREWRGDSGKTISAIELSAVGGAAKVETLKVYPMQSIWKK